MAAQTAAIGFSVHSGWAAMVVLSGGAAALTVLARARVDMIDDLDGGSKQPYHAVEFLCVEEAAGRLQGYLDLATAMAGAAIAGLIHAADGDHFRNALSAAAEGHGLRVSRIQTRALEEHAAAQLHLPRKQMLDSVNDLGRQVGPPWAADQKKAALLAWTLLAKGAT
jgi:hypothetical protein